MMAQRGRLREIVERACLSRPEFFPGLGKRQQAAAAMMAQPAPPASATSASASSSSLSATAAVPPPSAGGMGVFAGTSNGGWSYLPTAAPSATPSSLPTANPVAAGSPTGGWTVISRKNHNHHRTRPASVGYSSLLPPQAPPHQPSSTHHRLDPNRPESTALGVRQPQITRIAGPVVGDSHQLHDSSQTHSSLPGIAFQERLPSPFPPPGLQRPPELRKTYSAAVVHPLVSAAAPQPSPQITPTPDLYRSPTFGSSIPAMQSRLNPQQLSLAGQKLLRRI
ncbi:hypothetical protein DFJ73DRAFT_21667 [Zopfochytrium polystomum]|nr:hypothetical protein DFJ73DRAFT_21667 [Zopfochytrium polystomum]